MTTIYDENNHLRNVTMRPYRDDRTSFTLNTWYTGRTDNLGKSILRYQFQQGDKLLFEGEDFRLLTYARN